MAETAKIKLSETLLRLIVNRGLSRNRKKLCSQVGISESALTQYIHGRSRPSFDTLIGLAEFFDVSLDYLVFGREAESQAADYDPVLSYVDHALTNLLAKTDRRAWLFTRIAQALRDKIDEAAISLESRLTIPAGLVSDNETMKLEEHSQESRIISMNLQYDIIKADHGTEAAGRFLPVVSRNIGLRRKYKFLLPGANREWAPVVGSFRKILSKQGLNSGLVDDYCEFCITDAPIFSGAGFYRLDVSDFEKMQPILYLRVREFINEDGWLGYVIPPSMEPQSDALMDLWHLERGVEGFEALWRQARPV